MDFHQMRFRSMGTSFINTDTTINTQLEDASDKESQHESKNSQNDLGKTSRTSSTSSLRKASQQSVPDTTNTTKTTGKTSRTSSTSSLRKASQQSVPDTTNTTKTTGKTSRTSSTSSLRKASQQSVPDTTNTTKTTAGKTSRTSSTSSLRKSSQPNSKEETLPTDTSKDDFIVPEAKDEFDAPAYDSSIEKKYFVFKSAETELEKKVLSIPAKNYEDLEAAKQIVENFPNLTEIFLGFNSFAVKLSEVISLKDTDFVNTELKEDSSYKLKWAFFTHQNIDERKAMGDYLARINIPELLYNYYVLGMKSLELDFWTETILEEKKVKPVTAVLISFRGHLWNFTDVSPLFADRLTSTGIFKYYVEDLKAMKEDISDPEKIDFLFESSMGAIHNCCKNPAIRHIFQELGMVSHIIPYLKSDSPRVKMIVLLTLSYIISEDDNELLLAEKSIFNFMLWYLISAWKMKDHRYNGFSAIELVTGLMGLAKNDENKKLLMEIGSLPVLIAIIKTGSDVEKKPAIECIWELSFDKKNQKTILADKEMMTLLTSLEKSEDKNIVRAASGALWVLNAEERERMQEKNRIKRKKSEEMGSGHIMLSYAWMEQKMVIKVKEYLKRLQFRVWMDIDNMGGSTLQAMAEAVEKSSVVLVCMSERYKQSQNCRNEAEYAFSLKKDIVPLIMERGYQPDGWLGMIKGTKLFFDFSGKYPFETKIEQLIKELGSRGKPLQGADEVEGKFAVIKSAPLEAGRGATVAEWASKDVQNWMQKNNLSSNSALKSLTGEQLEFLRKLSLRAPEFYFDYIERKFGLKSLEELMKFSKAVDKL